MAKYEFVKPTMADAEYIATNLKPDNYSELFCAIGPNALDDILDGLKHSDEIGCLHINGTPAAVYGVRKASIMSDEGRVWLLMTKETENHKVFVGRQTKKAVRGLLKRYDRLYNWVNVGNDNIMRWLKWLGAEIHEPAPHGVYNLPHHFFEFRKDDE